MKNTWPVMVIAILISVILQSPVGATQVRVQALLTNHSNTSSNTSAAWKCLWVEVSGTLPIASPLHLSFSAAGGYPGLSATRYALQLQYTYEFTRNTLITLHPVLSGQRTIQHYSGDVDEVTNAISSGLHLSYALKPDLIFTSGAELNLWSRVYLIAPLQQEQSVSASGQRFFAEVCHQNSQWQLLGGVKYEVNQDTFINRLPRTSSATSIYIGASRQL